MKAVPERLHGGPEVLEVQDLARPEPGPGEVLVRVAAAGLNRADALQREGKYPVPEGAPAIYGLEVAGTVAALGEGATGPAPGEEVVALLAGGGYAEYVAVDARQVLPAPRGIGAEEAAALPEAAATVWTNLVEVAGLDPERPGPEGDPTAVLVHGGTGGIGLFAVQLFRALGFRVLTTVGDDRKVLWLRTVLEHQEHALRAAGRRPGPVEIVNHRTQDFVEVVAERTGGQGVRAVLDVVGGRYLDANVRCLGQDGHLVTIAVQGGKSGELDLARLMSRRASVTGTTLRGRSAAAKGRTLAGVRETVWPLVEAGLLGPFVDRSFPLARVREAHEYFESGAHRGKVVLTIG